MILPLNYEPMRLPAGLDPREGVRRFSREALPSPPVRRPAHVVRMLALVHHLQSVINRWLVLDRAMVTKRLGW
jgi:hypothetical protein